MPGGIYKDVSQEERRRLAEERYQQLIGGLALDGGVSSDPPIELGDVLDEMLLNPEAATRAGDAAAVSPQEYGKTSPTLLDEEMLEEPEPLQAPLVPLDQREPVDPNAPPMDPIDVELLPPPAPERLHVDAAMRQQLPPPSAAERFAENYGAVAATLPPPPPPAAQTAASVTPPVSQGKSPDLYGVDGEGGFTRERAILAARDAYGKETARRDPTAQFDRARAEGTATLDSGMKRTPTPDALPNPYGPSESRWEDEFLENHEALSDKQIRTRTALIGLFGGVIGGDPNMAKDYANREFKVRAGYDEGLAQARARDKGDRRIDQGLAEAIASTGNVSPEEAATLTYNSPLVAAFTNGMYGQGLSSERLARLEQQFQQGELGKTSRQREAAAADAQQGVLRATTTLTQADILAGRKGQGVDAPLTDEDETLIAANLVDRFDLPLRVGRAAVAGNYDDVPAELQNKVEAAVIQGKVAVRDRVGARSLSAAPASAGGAGSIRTAQGVSATRKKASLTSAAWKERAQVRTVMSSAKRARAAWNTLSPEAKNAYVKVGPKAWPALRQILGTEKYQAEITNLKALSNELVRMEAGLSQTQSELTNQMEAQGIAPNWWAPLNDPAAYDEFLDRITERTRQRYQSLKADGVWDVPED